MKVFPQGRRGWLRAGLLPMAIAAASFGAAMFTTRMPGRSHSGPLPPLDAALVQRRDRLRGHVETLAGRIGERNLWRPEALAGAARYVEDTLETLGLHVQSQAFTVEGVEVRNLAVVLPGTGTPGREEIVVVGAHYDSVLGSPGADDNATGVAALLEIARTCAAGKRAHTLHLVAFVNEEPPFFLTGDMGSLRYARRLRAEGRTVVAMLSLETIGYYSDRPGSQQYPFPLSLFYPDRGDFIGFVGNTASRGLVHGAVASFRRHAAFPSEGLAAPGWITGVGWSDHWSFWQQGYPAVMVTDTALFRYPHYHAGTDRPAEVDYDRLSRAVAGLAKVVEDLARGREE